MGVSKEEREAYEAGQEEARAQEAPMFYLISPSSEPAEPDLQSAWQKGLEGEQLDDDKG